MSRIGDILTRCAELLVPVVNGANVYAYTPYANTEAGIKAIMQVPDESGTARIHMWTVTRESTPAIDKSIPAVEDKHRLLFRAWYSLRDDGSDSYTEFTEEIEAMRDAFRNNRTLTNSGGTDPKVFLCYPPQVRVQMTGSFVGYLVHYAEVLIEAEDYPIDYVNRP